jgi:hypothetical protein
MGKVKSFGFRALLLSFIVLVNSLDAQEFNNSRLLILPFDTTGIDPVSVQTAESILGSEIKKISKIDIIPENKTINIPDSTSCYSRDCALKVGKEVGATEVFACKLAPLGKKVIVQYFLLDVDSGKTLLMDQITAINLKALEFVMKKIATNIASVKRTDTNTMALQKTQEPLRKFSRKNIGVSFGYLFPTVGYDGDDKIFAINLHLEYELEKVAAGMLLGIRDGFAMGIYGDYLFSKKNVSPYAGGGFGYHWINHSTKKINTPYTYTVTKKADGFELTLNTGLRILRTYNFQILVNLEYIMTFTDYKDRAIVFTIGIL